MTGQGAEADGESDPVQTLGNGHEGSSGSQPSGEASAPQGDGLNER